MSFKAISAIATLAVTAAIVVACEQQGAVAPDGAAVTDALGERAVDERGERHYGVPVKVGNGRARSYVVRRKGDGRTVELGVALDETALQGLPAPMAHPGGSDGHAHVDAHEYLLALPQRHGTAAQHITVDWNPGGHEPPGIYDVPHFDFHFYTISQAERDAMVPTDPMFMTKAARYPLPSASPAGFMVLPPAPAPVPAVPRMGVHWSNLAAAELQPPSSPQYKPFTHTFIYGSWDGAFIFAEPMITRAFLLSKPDISVPVSSLPANVRSALRTNEYRIRWDAKAREVRIALSLPDAL
jgi:hypothetical protein